MKLIGKCQSLEHLELTDAPITDQGLAYLQSLRSLRVLRLRTTGDPDLGLISDLGMEYLSGLNTLQSLWLFGSGISDEGFSHLDNLHLLSEIVVRGTSISEEGLERSFDQSYFVQFAEPPTYTPSISRSIR